MHGGQPEALLLDRCDICPQPFLILRLDTRLEDELAYPPLQALTAGQSHGGSGQAEGGEDSRRGLGRRDHARILPRSRRTVIAQAVGLARS